MLNALTASEKEFVASNIHKYKYYEDLLEVINSFRDKPLELLRLKKICKELGFYLKRKDQAIRALDLGKKNKGKIRSKEFKDKLSIANKGKKLSKESIEKRNIKLIGKKRSAATKKKMSESRLAFLNKQNARKN